MQVGDQLDRGDNEIQILYFLERLQKEAAAAGGALHILNGNHETMNVGGRFRYATTPGRIDFLRWQLMQSIGAGLKVTLLYSSSVYKQRFGHQQDCARLPIRRGITATRMQ